MCPVSRSKGISFTIVVYGENAFWAIGFFFPAAMPRVATGKRSLQCDVSRSYNASMT